VDGGKRHCIVCGSGGPFSALFEQWGFRLVKCQCGLVFQDPQPDEKVLEDCYYHDSAFSEALLGDLRQITVDNARHKDELLRSAGVRLEGMRVLDIGASSGAWLELANARGCRATGVEIGATTAASARSRGLDVRTGTLGDILATLDDERFDLITFWDVLEHLPDPRYELAMARTLLTGDGLIAATFPNVEGLYPQLTYRFLTRPTGVWEYPELPAHLYDFAPRTARRLLAGQGYDVQLIRTFAIPYGFYRSTSLSPARLGSGLRGKLLRVAFDVLHRIFYPLARARDRGNSMFVLARPAPFST
jgi:2-polyprenyl-3-methyl-5-hydroxy-6-metoxy-1,4-benzoquinol methylase